MRSNHVFIVLPWGIIRNRPCDSCSGGPGEFGGQIRNRPILVVDVSPSAIVCLQNTQKSWHKIQWNKTKSKRKSGKTVNLRSQNWHALSHDLFAHEKKRKQNQTKQIECVWWAWYWRYKLCNLQCNKSIETKHSSCYTNKLANPSEENEKNLLVNATLHKM